MQGDGFSVQYLLIRKAEPNEMEDHDELGRSTLFCLGMRENARMVGADGESHVAHEPKGPAEASVYGYLVLDSYDTSHRNSKIPVPG